MHVLINNNNNNNNDDNNNNNNKKKKKKKKVRKKETHPTTIFSIYLKKIINDVGGERIRMLIRYIFDPFHIVGLQRIV